jgi:hypothetical protein
MEYRYKRIVVGRNSEGKSAVLTTTSDAEGLVSRRRALSAAWVTSARLHGHPLL